MSLKPWYELVDEQHYDIPMTRAVIRFGSDVIKVTDAYPASETAKIAAEYFILGIEYMRGSQ